MPFTVKDWKDSPDASTPVSAASLEDLETRVTTYTDLAKGAFSASRTAAVSLTTGSVVPYDTDSGTDRFDIAGWFDVTTQVGRYTPQTAGYYDFSWSVEPSAALAADVYWVASLRKNGTEYARGQVAYQRGVGFRVNSCGAVLSVPANGSSDFFDVIITHGVGSAQALTLSAATTYFRGHLAGTF